MLASSESDNHLSTACIFHPVSCIPGPTSTLQPVLNRAEPGQISITSPTRAPINLLSRNLSRLIQGTLLAAIMLPMGHQRV